MALLLLARVIILTFGVRVRIEKKKLTAVELLDSCRRVLGLLPDTRKIKKKILPTNHVRTAF